MIDLGENTLLGGGIERHDSMPLPGSFLWKGFDSVLKDDIGEAIMKLTRVYSLVRVAGRKVEATNYTQSKDWLRDFLQYLRQHQTLMRRLETATNRYMGNLKEEKDKDKDK